MADIHHYAWRARFRNQTAYIAARDAERFGNWTKEQCSTDDCVEVSFPIPPRFRSSYLPQKPWMFQHTCIASNRIRETPS